MVIPGSISAPMNQVFRQFGFTLIELMVAVAVAGAIVAYGLPMLQDVVLNQRVRTSASDFHTALLLARSEAIKRGSSVDIDINTDGWEVASGATVLLTKDDLHATVDFACSTDADTSPETCPSSISYTRTGRLDVGDNPFEIRFFITGNSNTLSRCVGITLSGIANVTLDSDGNPANGC